VRPGRSRRFHGAQHRGAAFEVSPNPIPSLSLTLTRCCVEVNRSQYNLKGEWFHRPGEAIIKEGGHSIAIVGWNDHYKTETGLQGGWVIRNSWEAHPPCTRPAPALHPPCTRPAPAMHPPCTRRAPAVHHAMHHAVHHAHPRMASA
jgi:hypothetical protein